MASKKMGVVAVLSCLFLVACAGQSNSGKTTLASSEGTSGSTEATVNGNEVAMSDAEMMSDESMFEDSFSDE